MCNEAQNISKKINKPKNKTKPLKKKNVLDPKNVKKYICNSWVSISNLMLQIRCGQHV